MKTAELKPNHEAHPSTSGELEAPARGLTDSPWLMGFLFLGTFAALVAVIIFVLVTGSIRSMMSISAIAYSLGALGFLGVIGWAFAKGQFTEYESVKDTIFEIEARR